MSCKVRTASQEGTSRQGCLRAWIKWRWSGLKRSQISRGDDRAFSDKRKKVTPSQVLQPLPRSGTTHSSGVRNAVSRSSLSLYTGMDQRTWLLPLNVRTPLPLHYRGCIGHLTYMCPSQKTVKELIRVIWAESKLPKETKDQSELKYNTAFPYMCLVRPSAVCQNMQTSYRETKWIHLSLKKS